MPTYEYACTQCGEPFEIQASISAKEKGLTVICPKCGSKKCARVFSSVTVMGARKGWGRPPMCGPQAGPGCCG